MKCSGRPAGRGGGQIASLFTDELLRGTVLEHQLVRQHLCDRVSLDCLEREGMRKLGDPIHDDQDEAEVTLALWERCKDVDLNTLQWRRC